MTVSVCIVSVAMVAPIWLLLMTLRNRDLQAKYQFEYIISELRGRARSKQSKTL